MAERYEELPGPPMWGPAYEKWCGDVVALMFAAHRVRNHDQKMSSLAFLHTCRGDEPFDAYECGDSPEEYVEFLMTPNEDDGDDGYLDPTVEL